MKKTTLISLFLAILTVISLVSCNITNNPIPDETSSEITTDDVTTEEKITTEEETLDLDPNWVNDIPPVTYRYLDGLPNDKWYFEWTPPPSESNGMNKLAYYRNYMIIEEDVFYAIQTPLRYEIEKDGLLFRFDFFERDHFLGSFMQIRITVINIAKDRVTIYDDLRSDTYVVIQDVEYGMQGRNNVIIAFDGEEHASMEGTGTIKTYTLLYGESYAFDRVMIVANLGHFELQEWQYLEFSLVRADRYGDGLPGRPVAVQVPIEYVDINDRLVGG